MYIMAIWTNFQDNSSWSNDPQDLVATINNSEENWQYYDGEWWAKVNNKSFLNNFSDVTQTKSTNLFDDSSYSQFEILDNNVKNIPELNISTNKTSLIHKEEYTPNISTTQSNQNIPETFSEYAPNISTTLSDQSNQNIPETFSEYAPNISTTLPDHKQPIPSVISVMPIIDIVSFCYGKYESDHNIHKTNLYGLNTYDFWYAPDIQAYNPDPSVKFIVGPFSYNSIINWIYDGYFTNTHFYCAIGYHLTDQEYVTTSDLVEYELELQKSYSE